MTSKKFNRARDKYFFDLGVSEFEEDMVNYNNPLLKTNDDHEFYKMGVEEAKNRAKKVDISIKNGQSVKTSEFGVGRDDFRVKNNDFTGQKRVGQNVANVAKNGHFEKKF